jgi:hypothetical protein
MEMKRRAQDFAERDHNYLTHFPALVKLPGHLAAACGAMPLNCASLGSKYQRRNITEGVL